MKEQQVEILRMLEEGKINAEEANKLLEELRLATESEKASLESARKPAGKMIRIRVFEGNLEKPKVRVSVPLSLAKFALRFVPKDAQTKINDLDIDLDEIVRQIEEGAEGKLVEVDDEEEKTRVEIFVE